MQHHARRLHAETTSLDKFLEFYPFLMAKLRKLQGTGLFVNTGRGILLPAMGNETARDASYMHPVITVKQLYVHPWALYTVKSHESPACRTRFIDIYKFCKT